MLCSIHPKSASWQGPVMVDYLQAFLPILSQSVVLLLSRAKWLVSIIIIFFGYMYVIMIISYISQQDEITLLLLWIAPAIIRWDSFFCVSRFKNSCKFQTFQFSGSNYHDSVSSRSGASEF